MSERLAQLEAKYTSVVKASETARIGDAIANLRADFEDWKTKIDKKLSSQDVEIAAQKVEIASLKESMKFIMPSKGSQG